MRIPPYWQRGTYTDIDDKGNQRSFVAWGWSFKSQQEAEREGQDRARRIFQHFVYGSTLERYAYSENPLREEIISQIQGGKDDVAVITRNRYGALVLNSASVLFADIDFPEQKSKGLFKKMFGGKDDTPDVKAATLQQVKSWATAHPNTPFRIYRTYAGLRLLFTGQIYQAGTQETDELLASLGCDPLYRHLTRKQESFRARLTPKPWRCNCPNPPNRFPWDTPTAEQKYRQWEQTYASKIQSYATCELIEVMGSEPTIDEIQQVIQQHDRVAVRSNLPLA